MSNFTILDAFETAAANAAKAIATCEPGTGVLLKGGGDYAAEADLKANAAITQELQKFQSRISLLSEENPETHVHLTDKAVFVWDPLDGTHVFNTGAPEWGINLVYLESGVPKVALMAQPALNRCFTAIAGGGCWLNGEPFRIPQPKLLDEQAMVLALPISHAGGQKLLSVIEKLMAASLVGTTRCLGCAVANTAEVLGGRVHAYLNATGGKVYDLAAPQLVVQEAGGIVTSPDGQPVVWDAMSKPAIFSANARIHERILTALR